MSDPIVERLDKLIAAMRDLQVAQLDPWWGAEKIAALLDCSAGHVLQRFACRKGFPKALRIGGGHPKWRVSEIHAWALAEREKTGGRKRRKPEQENDNQGAP